jgi:NADPH:quinone reductase-like Zn-dependent oxidoreductase
VAFPRIQGADVCGRVIACGEEAPPRLRGRRVLVDPWLRDPSLPEDAARCGYLGSERDGGFAEYVAVPARNIHPIESDLGDAALAAFATAYLTAANMLARAQVRAGEDVLVTGASGGVGAALVQLARLRGARVIAQTRPGQGIDKEGALLSLGADRVICAAGGDLPAALGRDQVDVIADVVGGDAWGALLSVLRRGGRYACAGAIAGADVSLDLRALYLRDLTLAGATVPPPHLFGELVSLIAAGALRPPVAATYPLPALREAQGAFLRKQHVGKIVIHMGGGAS